MVVRLNESEQGIKAIIDLSGNNTLTMRETRQLVENLLSRVPVCPGFSL